MSPVRRGAATVPVPSAEALAAAVTELEAAVESGGAQLPADASARARAVADKMRARTSQRGGHTVVALAGATGSGKSSIFNALVGADVAAIGARRPTTAHPTAAIWGDAPVGGLLDWLGVSARHHVDSPCSDPAAETAGDLCGLVLLDLPDFDSRELSHRAEAERILELVDVFVWVTDPQKYADARLHDDYVAALATHDAVMMVVLNQVDHLDGAGTAACAEDLRRLMALDGLADATVLATSVRTGQGVDELRQRLANAVAAANLARARLAADVRAAAQALRPAVAGSEPDLASAGRADLVDALATAAGVPVVVTAVDRDYRMEAASRMGWPFTRWAGNLRPRPLRRLHLDAGRAEISASDVRSVLGRSSLPPPTPAARAGVILATRRLADQAGSELPVPWADAVSDAATPPGPDLADTLDQAVVGTSLRDRSPAWWKGVSWLQAALAFAAFAGLAWMFVLILAGWLQFPDVHAPLWGPFPIPFLLIAAGLMAGLLLALLARFLARVGGRRRARAMERRLRESITEVTDEHILKPVGAVLERHRATREHLDRAAAV
jgi:GTP-binding protein EngB required for normal cell division